MTLSLDSESSGYVFMCVSSHSPSIAPFTINEKCLLFDLNYLIIVRAFAYLYVTFVTFFPVNGLFLWFSFRMFTIFQLIGDEIYFCLSYALSLFSQFVFHSWLCFDSFLSHKLAFYWQMCQSFTLKFMMLMSINRKPSPTPNTLKYLPTSPTSISMALIFF